MLHIILVVRMFHRLTCFILTWIEKLNPSNVTVALSPEFEPLAAAFFSGEEVPANFDILPNDGQSVPKSSSKPAAKVVKYKIDYCNFWGHMVQTNWLSKPTLSTFLIDVIMANEMEQSCRSRNNYREVKIIRHPDYQGHRDYIEALDKQETQRQPSNLTALGEDGDYDRNDSADDDNTRVNPSDLLIPSELPELAHPPVNPRSSRLPEQAKKNSKNKKVAPNTKRVTQDSIEDDPASATSSRENMKTYQSPAMESSPQLQLSPVFCGREAFSMSISNPRSELADTTYEEGYTEVVYKASQRKRKHGSRAPIRDDPLQGVLANANRGQQSQARASAT